MILRYSIAEGYDVKKPEQKTRGSAGIDLHIPQFTDKFVEDFTELNKKIAIAENYHDGSVTPYLTFAPSGELVLPPHTRAIVPSGLYFDIPSGWMLEGANRGSVSSIQGVVHGAHIVDSDYQGMVFMSIINTSESNKYFMAGSALLQVLLREAPLVSLAEVSYERLYLGKQSDRGTGALGSTNHG